MNFTKFFLVVALILAVVGSSVAAPIIGALGTKAVKYIGQEATEKAIVKVFGKEALIKVSNKMGEHALKSAAKKAAATKAAEEAAKKAAEKAAQKAAQKAAGEGAKKISNKKIAGAVIGTGAVVGTGVWGFNQLNKAGAQPVEEQPKTE